jgi:uncharacterized membrane protein
MGEFIGAFVIFAVVFGLFDAIWLKSSSALYKKHLSHIMRDKPNFVAAAVFYVVYVAGVTAFALMPPSGSLSELQAVLTAGAIALLCYATYDLTNLATVKGWPVKIVIVDILWGTLATSLAAFVTLRLLTVFGE